MHFVENKVNCKTVISYFFKNALKEWSLCVIKKKNCYINTPREIWDLSRSFIVDTWRLYLNVIHP